MRWCSRRGEMRGVGVTELWQGHGTNSSGRVCRMEMALTAWLMAARNETLQY